MPNYSAGKDNGDVTSHPSYLDSTTTNVGPFRLTYNGLLRTNSGVTNNDESADSIRTHINQYLANLDITLTEQNATVTPEENKLVLRGEGGDIYVKTLHAESISLVDTDPSLPGSPVSSGILYGGTY